MLRDVGFRDNTRWRGCDPLIEDDLAFMQFVCLRPVFTAFVGCVEALAMLRVAELLLELFEFVLDMDLAVGLGQGSLRHLRVVARLVGAVLGAE